MKKSQTSIILVILLIFTAFTGSSFAESNSNSDKKKQIIQTIKQIETAQKKLARQFNKLSASAKEEILLKTSSKANSDDDSINDYLEGALKLNKCSNDSDNDGISDSDEYNNQDGDDQPVSGQQFEVHKTIQAIDSSSLVLGNVTYVITQQTKLLDDKKNTVSIDFFSVGKCVEAEGYVSSNQKIVEKLKEDDDC